METNDRIVINPKILTGKPVIKGTRLAVDFILGLLANGWSEEEILRNYPGLTHDDILACLRYAYDSLKDEKVYLISSDNEISG
jgi:uncharacterized protein (DUF433 family)